MSQAAISSYCVAKTRLMHIEDDYCKKRKPLSDRLDEIKSHIRTYMETNNVPSLLVTWNDVNTPIRRFLRLKHTSTIGPLNLVGIEQAVLSIESKDLREQYDLLRKKPKRKRNADDVESKAAAVVSIGDVWDAVVAQKIREKHLRESNCLQMTFVEHKNSDPQLASPGICKLASEWYNIDKVLDTLMEQNSKDCKIESNVIAEQEPLVVQYLHQTHPEEKSKEVILRYKEESRPFMIKSKESCKLCPVRITKFKPIIHTSVSNMITSHRVVDFSPETVEQVKHELAQILKEKYAQFQEENKQVKTYVSLDKVPVRKHS